MNHTIEKFVSQAKSYANHKSMHKMPPHMQLQYIMDKAERINKLAYVTDAEKQEGLDIIWALYSKVQKIIMKKGYTGDESWHNAKSNGKEWNADHNSDINFSTYGDAFTDIIDSAQMPNPTKKVVRYEDE
jgi:hypothetical protein